MRSIIDEIAAAEQQADEIRVRAAAEAREQIARAGESAAGAIAELDEMERERTRVALSDAEVAGERAAKDMLAGMAADSDRLCAAASARMDTAVDYLLKKVQGIA